MVRGHAALLASALVLGGCASQTVPDPRDAARAYAEAARRGDADALYGLLSARSREVVGAPEVRRMVADERDELAEQGRELALPGARTEATARVRYADGEEAALDLRGGRFLV